MKFNKDKWYEVETYRYNFIVKGDQLETDNGFVKIQERSCYKYVSYDEPHFSYYWECFWIKISTLADEVVIPYEKIVSISKERQQQFAKITTDKIVEALRTLEKSLTNLNECILDLEEKAKGHWFFHESRSKLRQKLSSRKSVLAMIKYHKAKS